MYTPPLAEITSMLATVGELDGLMPEEAGDLAPSILAAAGKLAERVLAPLNPIGDRIGVTLSEGRVTLAPGFADAYDQYRRGGWTSLNADPEFGGQGLPFVLSCAVQEIFTSANMAFSLSALLNNGAIAALQAHGSAQQKQDYLTQLIAGDWTGTMNLTEPQAGSDVGAITTSASPAADGSYRIRGSKIFITWGDHDAAENIVHLVLARVEGAPKGTKGISLFLVPKVLPDGTRNDLRCISIEKKLGLHGSPTCTMSFGDHGQCIGWLVGEENAGMRAMFTMMNHARISVALQGVAIGERALQQALAYAGDRVQSARIDAPGVPVAIIEHADVRRMLFDLKARTEAARALVYFTAATADRAHQAQTAEDRAAARARTDLLTPVAKAWATDAGVQVANDAIQIFGGMGFIEETGAAQHLRDARIAPIYEGTNGIQALDLVLRKLPAGGGAAWRDLLAEFRGAAVPDGCGEVAERALAAVENACEWALEQTPQTLSAIAVPLLQAFGTVSAGMLLARQAAEDRKSADSFIEAKRRTAVYFFLTHLQRVESDLASLADRSRAIAETDAGMLASSFA